MSVRETIILNRLDLRYLLIDTLRLYSDSVIFIGGNNPYRFSINKKEFYVLIKNVHESGDGRSNQDECRIQVSKTSNFNDALSSMKDVIVLGYFADERVFTAWNPFLMRERFNTRDTISLYSRFSTQREASRLKIAVYVDSNKQSVISFQPKYLGLYLENLSAVQHLSKEELRFIADRSDASDEFGKDDALETAEAQISISHSRQRRDPNFARKVNEAYDSKCAMCGIQLGLVEAAHIIPHAHEKGTDEVNNGVILCSLHHNAYDRGLIYFNDSLEIRMNKEKLKYLNKLGRDGGFFKFEELAFEKLQIPRVHHLQPNVSNIRFANEARGIDTD